MTVTPESLAPAGQAAPAPRPPERLPWLNGALLLAAGAVAFHPASVTWNLNGNYSYGWWIPLVSLFLFWERWPGRPAREPRPLGAGAWPLLVAGGALFFALRLATEADPDWRPGLWLLAGLYIAVLLAWLRVYGGNGWLRHFAFPVGFLVLSLPWFFGLEHPLTQGLMRWNASTVATSLRLLGIPALAEGNVIDLTTGKLGVEEACSGILSLQSSVMLGCLLGEVYRLNLARRVALVLLTMILALAGNYGRTLFLALLGAFHGPTSVEAWHDTAGYAILIFTGVGSWILSLVLREARAPATAAKNPVIHTSPAPWPPARTLAVAVFVIAAISEATTQGWFAFRESQLTRHPAWTAQLPQPPSFKAEPVGVTAREILFCDADTAGTWRDVSNWRWTAYWFFYNPKPSNRVVLGWHNPDNCLPSVGLKPDEVYPDFHATVNGLDFFVQPKRFADATDNPSHKLYLFWLVYPLSGDLPAEMKNNPDAPLASKFGAHLRDVLDGNRGVGVETLEVGITGPPDYAAAKAAYLKFLGETAWPEQMK